MIMTMTMSPMATTPIRVLIGVLGYLAVAAGVGFAAVVRLRAASLHLLLLGALRHGK